MIALMQIAANKQGGPKFVTQTLGLIAVRDLLPIRHIRNLRVMASKLSYELMRQLVHCLIFSKLHYCEYCNGLLYGLPDSTLRKLQKIQNSCVRFLFGTQNIKKWDSVTPFLKEAQ